MAARYWINGTGNWNDTANWSETSGGIGGASVPTMDDDVYFDSNSGTGTVTVNAIANMRDCTFVQTQLITLTNAAYAFNIFGNWTLCSDTYLNTSFTGTGYVYLKATTSVNITSNSCTRGWNNLYFDGVGGTWTNQDDWLFNSTMNFYMRNGHWDTNSFRIGGYSIGYWMLYTYGTGIKTISLQSSLLKNCVIRFEQNLNFTFNCGTSIIYSQSYFNGGNFTFYSVVMDYTTGGVIMGNNTFSYLNLHPTTNPRYAMGIYGNNTITNELNISGYSSRCLIASGNIGTPRTITCNGTITASNVDFRDIAGAGTANWDLSNITGGSGDCGGNSGITFTPAQTQYFKHTSGAVNWSDATKWFSNYERTIAGRVPLPQDNAIFDENSFTGASTLTLNVLRIGGMLINSISQSLAVVLYNSLLVFLNFKLGAAVLSGNYLVEFDGYNRTFTDSVYLGISNSAPNNFTVLGNNTFSELILEPDRKVKFTAGTTQTVSKLKALGTPTNPIKIDSTSSSRFNLVKTGSEPNECNFIDISNSNASPSGSWPAGYNSNDMGNNAGWEFNTDDFVPQIINL